MIEIPPGIHHYKYVVDDSWRLDPAAATVIAQGVVNNTIEVKPSVFEDTRAQEMALSDSDDDVDDDKVFRASSAPRTACPTLLLFCISFCLATSSWPEIL